MNSKKLHEHFEDGLLRTAEEVLAAKKSTPSFLISESGQAITCTTCDMTSWHPEDVKQKYCAHCQKFHDAP